MVHTYTALMASYPVNIVSATLPQAESESTCSSPALNNDSSSATGVGLFLGGLVAGVTGVLLIEGIVCGAFRLRKSKHRRVYNFNAYIWNLKASRCELT